MWGRTQERSPTNVTCVTPASCPTATCGSTAPTYTASPPSRTSAPGALWPLLPRASWKCTWRTLMAAAATKWVMGMPLLASMKWWGRQYSRCTLKFLGQTSWCRFRDDGSKSVMPLLASMKCWGRQYSRCTLKFLWQTSWCRFRDDRVIPLLAGMKWWGRQYSRCPLKFLWQNSWCRFRGDGIGSNTLLQPYNSTRSSLSYFDPASLGFGRICLGATLAFGYCVCFWVQTELILNKN